MEDFIAEFTTPIPVDPNFSNTNLVYDNSSFTNKEQIKLDHGILKSETTYYWRLRYSDIGGWSRWSNRTGADYGPGAEFTTLVDAADGNKNGIPDAQEAAGFVDMDNDGNDDNSQADIAALINVVSGNTVAVKTASGIVAQAQTQNADDLSNTTNKPADYNFPDGVFNFRIEDLTPGEEIDITFYISEIFPADGIWYKYSESNGWQDYTGRIVGGIDTDEVTLEFKDGDYGDMDGIANGVIVDPGGPGYKADDTVLPPSPPVDPPDEEEVDPPPPPASAADPAEDGGGGGGCFIATVSF